MAQFNLYSYDESSSPPPQTDEEYPSSCPPQTDDDEENKEQLQRELRTNKRKKKQLQRNWQKSKDEKINHEKKILKNRYSAPFDHIWKQLKCIQFNDGKFMVGDTELLSEILSPYVSVEHIRDYKYKVKFQLRSSFNTAIGISTKDRITYGTASQITPRYSYVLDEEVMIMQMDISVDMISMLHNYYVPKTGDKNKLYRWIDKDTMINGPRMLKYWYDRMWDTFDISEPVPNDDGDDDCSSVSEDELVSD